MLFRLFSFQIKINKYVTCSHQQHCHFLVWSTHDVVSGVDDIMGQHQRWSRRPSSPVTASIHCLLHRSTEVKCENVLIKCFRSVVVFSSVHLCHRNKLMVLTHVQTHTPDSSPFGLQHWESSQLRSGRWILLNWWTTCRHPQQILFPAQEHNHAGRGRASSICGMLMTSPEQKTGKPFLKDAVCRTGF